MVPAGEGAAAGGVAEEAPVPLSFVGSARVPEHEEGTVSRASRKPPERLEASLFMRVDPDTLRVQTQAFALPGTASGRGEGAKSAAG
jgi:hypothetical protein